MPGVMVICEEHGPQESLGMTHDGGARLFVDGVNTECPVCGRMSPVVNGMYTQNATGGLRAVLLPTPEQARILQQQFRQIDRISQSRKYSDDDAKHEIEALLDRVARTSPAVAAEYRKVTAGRPRKVWGATAKAITAALAVVGAYNTFADFSDRVAELVSYFLAR